MLFDSRELRLVENCDRGFENAAKNVSYFSLFTIWCGFCAILSEKAAWFNTFPVSFKTVESSQLSFSRLQIPDWSIQISRAPPVCKVVS